jgi:hypothetical protein
MIIFMKEDFIGLYCELIEIQKAFPEMHDEVKLPRSSGEMFDVFSK